MLFFELFPAFLMIVAGVVVVLLFFADRRARDAADDEGEDANA